MRYGGIFNGEISDNELACQGGWADHIEQLDWNKLKDKKCFNAPKLVPKENSSENEYLCKNNEDVCEYVSTSPIDHRF